jgi:hypothetical protein
MEERYAVTQPIVLLVDGLDEVVSPADDDLIGLLAHAVTGGRVPRMLRLVVTTSPHPDVVAALASAGAVWLNLDEAEELAAHDVRDWAYNRLLASGAPPDASAQIAERVATASAGNFLYARLVVDELADREADDVAVPVLPMALHRQYASAVARAVGFDFRTWTATHRRLLGVLAAARGGLTHHQLTGILGGSPTEVADLLRHWAPYLSGAIPSGPLELFHASFRQFLLSDDQWRVEADEAHAAIAQFFLDEYQDGWHHAEDDYALRHTAIHLAFAAQLAPSRQARGHYARLLTQLLVDTDFLAAKAQRLGPESLLIDVEAAGKSLVGDAALEAVRSLVERAASA